MKLGDFPADQFDDLAFPLWPHSYDGGGLTLDDYGVVIAPNGGMEVYSNFTDDGTETSFVFHFDSSPEEDAGVNLAVGPGPQQFYVQYLDHANSYVRPDSGDVIYFAWLPDDRWVRYTESAGTTTWEVAGEDKSWRTVASYATPADAATGCGIDFSLYSSATAPARAFSFNVPDDPAPPPSVDLVHPFTAAVYDREGNAQAGALVEIQGYDPPHDPAHVWLDKEHTNYVFDPSTLLTNADGLLTVWLPDGLYRWRSTVESVSSAWEPVELQDPLSGPTGPTGPTGPGGTSDIVHLELVSLDAADHSVSDVAQATTLGLPLLLIPGAADADEHVSRVHHVGFAQVLGLRLHRRTDAPLTSYVVQLRATSLADPSVLYVATVTAVPIESTATVVTGFDGPDTYGLPLGADVWLVEAWVQINRSS